MTSELKLDVKIGQVLGLQQEFKEMQQALILKEGILNDLIKDICINDLKMPSEGSFGLAEVIAKVREISKS